MTGGAGTERCFTGNVEAARTAWMCRYVPIGCHPIGLIPSPEGARYCTGRVRCMGGRSLLG